jgi:hypothetical protein
MSENMVLEVAYILFVKATPTMLPERFCLTFGLNRWAQYGSNWRRQARQIMVNKNCLIDGR